MSENLHTHQDSDTDGNVFNGLGVALIFNLILAFITWMLMTLLHLHVLAALGIALVGVIAVCLIGMCFLR